MSLDRKVARMKSAAGDTAGRLLFGPAPTPALCCGSLAPIGLVLHSEAEPWRRQHCCGFAFAPLFKCDIKVRHSGASLTAGFSRALVPQAW